MMLVLMMAVRGRGLMQHARCRKNGGLEKQGRSWDECVDA